MRFAAFLFLLSALGLTDAFFVWHRDDRFPWQSLETDALKVSWYQGDVSFGQAALNTAQSSLDSISRLVPLDLTQPVEIFLYADVDDLQMDIAPSGESWVAGHADPAAGIIRLVVKPGTEQAITMEQRIPHELMHVMLYRRVGAGYANLPAWLREGTATLAEMYPNADHERVIASAVTGNRLIPLRDLCTAFPSEAGQAFLAYAEARSFVKYLHDRYGSAGLITLAAAYADGVDCEHGTERVFGAPLSTLELDWRSSALGQNAFLSTVENIAPYLVLLCLVLIIPLVGIVGTLRNKRKLG